METPTTRDRFYESRAIKNPTVYCRCVTDWIEHSGIKMCNICQTDFNIKRDALPLYKWSFPYMTDEEKKTLAFICVETLCATLIVISVIVLLGICMFYQIKGVYGVMTMFGIFFFCLFGLLCAVFFVTVVRDEGASLFNKILNFNSNVEVLNFELSGKQQGSLNDTSQGV